ncbi:helix-turn-helix domain-containing protein [Schaalia cardiffensis]|uniref:helix-turn-helix domain-containing protein n=1 Tax=Schaalia cardiffensis TaxID=181487 RepID=UPI0023EFE922|nr:helix-turn-helix transcriptional regulator [Schaalia cardiffensis]
MSLEARIKNLRKQSGMSQESMGERIGVSRQAITKWENGTGVPDVSNLIAIAELFQVSLDELLSGEKRERKQNDYLFESRTEYDLDGVKDFDINLGGAHTVTMSSYEGEKVQVSLLSNVLRGIQEDYKVKIDDNRRCIDIDLLRLKGASEAQAKEGLTIQILIPQKYAANIELAVNAGTVQVNGIDSDKVELGGKISEIVVQDNRGVFEIDSNLDMIVRVMSHEGGIEINQVSATSRILLPSGYAFRAVRKGIATSISYECDGKPAENFSKDDAENYIEFNGITSELVIDMPSLASAALQ